MLTHYRKQNSGSVSVCKEDVWIITCPLPVIQTKGTLKRVAPWYTTIKLGCSTAFIPSEVIHIDDGRPF
jgi:hypothetical protein